MILFQIIPQMNIHGFKLLHFVMIQIMLIIISDIQEKICRQIGFGVFSRPMWVHFDAESNLQTLSLFLI